MGSFHAGARGSRRGAIGRLAAIALVCGLLGAWARVSPSSEGIGSTAFSESLMRSAGAALRQARSDAAAGDHERAEALLAAIAARHTVIADYADLLRMRLRVDAGRVADAIEMRTFWGHDESPLRSAFFALLGRAHLLDGDDSDALAAFARARELTDDPARLPGLILTLGDIQERSGDLDAALESFRVVWLRYPLSPEVSDATAGLDRLEKRLGTPTRTADTYRRRGDSWFRLRRNEAALADYERALEIGGLSATSTRRARAQRAQTLFRLRRYTLAVGAFDDLPQTDETRISRARALARSGKAEQAAGDLEALGKRARGRPGLRATLLAAILFEDEGEEGAARAKALYRSLVKRSPRSSYARAALWRLGWSAYREGRDAEAIESFDRLLKADGDPIASLRARYWRARTVERTDPKRAAQSLTGIAAEYPVSYYGWRARSRVGIAIPEVERAAIGPGTSGLRPTDLDRPRILLEAGMIEEARSELDRVLSRARGLSDRLSLAELYAEAGVYNRPQRLMVDAYAESLARGPVDGQIEPWWHAWPLPWVEEMRRATDDGAALDEKLVYAVMREESGFRPEVISVSGARGLLQLMPETATRVARKVDFDAFRVEDLIVPGVNIRLGSAYLSQLLARFDGRRSAAIGSYNAGPEAVARWIERNAGDDDEWVESIPYDQTRAYVKRVLRSWHAYRMLY
jgi:soluble lytic murein transglycosylase